MQLILSFLTRLQLGFAELCLEVVMYRKPYPLIWKGKMETCYCPLFVHYKYENKKIKNKQKKNRSS